MGNPLPDDLTRPLVLFYELYLFITCTRKESRVEQKWDKEIGVRVIKSMLSQELDVLINLCLRKLIIHHFNRIFFIREGNREDWERWSWGWGGGGGGGEEKSGKWKVWTCS